MLFQVDHRPHAAGRDPEKIKPLNAAEHERALELQRRGKWLHLWRVVGNGQRQHFQRREPGGAARHPEFAAALSVHGGRSDGALPASGLFRGDRVVQNLFNAKAIKDVGAR